MGIILDIVLLAIILLSTFLGYKKGLVKLAAKLFAGIIAIIITIAAYKPVSGMIINNTEIDEKIEATIVENTTKFIDEKAGENIVTENIENEIVPEQAKNIAKSAIYIVTALALFVVVKIVLSIIISLIGFIAELPILKQFNEVGGMAYGLLRGILISIICILIMGVITKINPENALNEKIQDSYLAKIVYENIVKF